MATVVDRFLAAVEANREKTAVMDKNGDYTYNRVDLLSNYIADRICNLKEVKQVIVLLPRTKDYVPAALGILRAGCAYVPLDTAYPIERKNIIFSDVGNGAIITDSFNYDADRELIEASDMPVILMDEICAMSDEELMLGESINKAVLDSEGLYVYTSGSTGRPKGVVQSMHVFDSMELNYWQDDYEVTGEDVLGFMTGFTFIVSLCTLLLPLTLGSKIYIFDEEERMNPKLMYEVIQRLGITVMSLAPKLLDTMFRLYPDNNLKCAMAGGEKIVRIPETDAVILENYGCSEAGALIYNRIYPGEQDNQLGRLSKGNTGFLIDDEGNRITEPHVIGELCVTSDSIAYGYNNLPEKTAEVFTPCPFDGFDRMCHTGDLMAFRDDGTLEYHGRKDYMVKINGYRVELAGIETLVNKFEGVSEAVCVVKKISGADTICCYYSAPEDLEKELIEYVKQYLAGYMIPGRWIRLDRLPRNANGKIDRAQLPEPEIIRDDTPYEPAANENESRIIAAAEKVFNVDRIGRNDDLFTYCSDSIMYMSLVAEIDDDNLLVSDLVKLRTPAAIAGILGQGDAFDAETDEEYRKNEYRLTDYQQHYYTFCNSFDDNKLGSVSFLVQFKKGLYESSRIAEAAREAVLQHPAFSTVIVKSADGEIRQRIDVAGVALPEVISLSEDEFNNKMNSLAQGFEFNGEALFRSRIYSTEKYEYFYMEVHHIISDKSSQDILLADMLNYLNGKELERDYYYSYLDKLNSDYEKGKGGTSYSAYQRHPSFDTEPDADTSMDVNILNLDIPFSAGLFQEKVKKINATPLEFLISATAGAMSRYNGDSKVMVNWIYSGRDSAKYSNMAGLMLRAITVPLDLSTIKDNASLIKEVHRINQESMSVETGCDDFRNAKPIADDVITVNYIPYVSFGDSDSDNDINVINMFGEKKKSRTNVFYVIYAENAPDKPAQIQLVYNKDLYKTESMEKFGEYFLEEIKSNLSNETV